MTSQEQPVAKPVLSPLGECAVDTERHVSAAGWDQPPRLFALATNSALLAGEPALADQLRDADPSGISAIEQEGMPRTSSIESMLGRLAWPAEVEGVLLAIERIVVPPEAENNLPESPEQAAEALAAHPDRRDVRLVVGVMRDGEQICLLRQREHDSDDKVAVGTDIAPGLAAALKASLED